jgi:DNA-binding transcriptional regulator PaaX
MKEKLIQILGLGAQASEAEIVAAVQKLAESGKAQGAINATERRIARKISDSGRALTREGAMMVIEQEDAEAARRKGKKS